MGNQHPLCPHHPIPDPSDKETDQNADVSSPSEQADIIFVIKGGSILTMDESNPTAEALAVTGEKITAVGRADAILKMKGPSTEVVELQGSQTLMPGLIEPHSHPSMFTAFSLFYDVSGFKCHSFKDVKRVMKQAVEETKHKCQLPLPWITFGGWDPVLIRDLPALNCKWLNKNVSSHYPVFVLEQSGHSCWVNDKALEICNITSETPNPPGGIIDKGKDGKPTGLLQEVPAIRLVTEKFLPPEKFKLLHSFFETLKWYSRHGITTTSDMGTFPLNPITIGALYACSLWREFPVRLGVYYKPKPVIKLETIFTTEKLWFPGVKVWSDGSPYTGTMACAEPYLKTHLTEVLEFDFKHHPCGVLIYESADKLADILRPFSDKNLAAHSHGERAIDMVLDAYEKLIKENPGADHRYRLDHVGLITEEQMKRAAELGVTVTFYVDHVFYYGAALRDDIIGPERANRFAPTALGNKCGVSHWTLHEDTPCSPLNPFLSMKNAVLRKTQKDGKVLGPEYCVSIDDALKAYTINAAWQLKREKEIGSLEVGKLADLVLLSDNPKTVQPERLTEIEVEATYVGGQQFQYKQ